jgi:hypothetical protein
LQPDLKLPPTTTTLALPTEQKVPTSTGLLDFSLPVDGIVDRIELEAREESTRSIRCGEQPDWVGNELEWAREREPGHVEHEKT